MMRSRFYLFDIYQLIALALLAILITRYVPISGLLDQLLSRPWVDAHGYWLRDNWYLVHIGHSLLKDLVLVVAIVHLLLWLKLKLQSGNLQLQRLCMLVVLGMASSVLIIGQIKSHSTHACPWSLLEIHTGQIDWHKVTTEGHCFPGGHASAGFSLLILYFAYRPVYPLAARWALLFALVMGALMSAVQMLRGAHFLSHNLWSLWWTWLIDYLIYRLCYVDTLEYHCCLVDKKTLDMNSST